MNTLPPWFDQLATLIHAGAVLTVTDLDGQVQHHSPLARALRLDDDDHDVIWIRPVFSRYTDPDGLDAFPLELTRRRALHITAHHKHDAVLTFELITGQRARITPATGNDRSDLQAWDAFTVSLNRTEREALEALSEDSWQVASE